MASATQTPTPVTTIPVTTEISTYGRVKYQSDVEINKETGEQTPVWDNKFVNDRAADKVLKEGKLDDQEAELEFKQSFKMARANSWDGVKLLFTDKDGNFNEEEAVAQVNNAISVKQANRARALIMATENGEYTFVPQAEPVDLTEEVCRSTSRRRTAFEKLFDDVKEQRGNFTPEMVQQLMALMQGAGISPNQ